MRTNVIAIIAVVACTASQVRAAEPDCVPQAQVDVAKIDASIVLVGEAHGTEEIPRFTLGLVCSLLRAGRPVILGIEHSGEQQVILNRYLQSSGDAAAKAALLQGVNWRTYADGRGSRAMFELVDAMRRLRLQNQPVAVLAFVGNGGIDVPTVPAMLSRVGPEDNATLNRLANEDMAHGVLSAMLVYRPYVVVVLSGYSHTSTVQAASPDPMFGTYRPMGQVIAAEAPVFTIGLESAGGEHSGTGRAGSRVYPLESGPLYESGVRIDAHVALGRLTASPLARDTPP